MIFLVNAMSVQPDSVLWEDATIAESVDRFFAPGAAVKEFQVDLWNNFTKKAYRDHSDYLINLILNCYCQSIQVCITVTVLNLALVIMWHVRI